MVRSPLSGKSPGNSLLVLCTAAVLGSVTVAQIHPLDLQSERQSLDSGYVANPTPGSRPVFRGTIHVPTATWLRLYFDHTNLPGTAKLELRSIQDGAVQWLDAQSLRDYGNSSAYFNGNRVTVTLHAGAHSRGNRVRVVRAEYERNPIGEPESICGPTDDRRPVTDKRIGRGVSGTSACTWWLIDEFTILTAGHCARVSGTPIIGFNIPFSDANGNLIHPPPEHQYPIDPSSLRRLNSGVGRDWAVVAARRNSNHGQYPGQRQGEWFELGTVPPNPTGVTIRITGNGRTSSPISPTWNAITKTHTGPLTSIASTSLGYRPDTTGGNSGSPVIEESTGKAIGIHTHGGCNASGGQNRGTRIDRSDLIAAIRAVRGSKVAGRLEPFGTSCTGSAGRPTCTPSGVPDVGGRITLSATPLLAQQAGAVLIGASRSSWRGLRLPYDLAPLGGAGCQLLVGVDASVPVGTSTGTMRYQLTIPTTRALIGNSAYLQYAAIDRPVPRRLPIVLTNAIELFVGG